MQTLKDGIRSKVRIDFYGRVHKEFRGTGARERFENEVAILKVLEERDCPYVPRVISADAEGLILTTTNCGRPASQISKVKSDGLFAELAQTYGVQHDDPEPRNITYSEQLGRFCVIDFELSQVLPDFDLDSPTGTPKLQRLRWASSTVTGSTHRLNQDALVCFYFSENQVAVQNHGEMLAPFQDFVFAVSDGVGGGRGGDFASRLAISSLKHYFSDDLSKNRSMSLEFLKELFTEIHDALNQQSLRNSEELKMACTLSFIWLGDAGQLHFGNVGDSRIYRFRENKLEQFSRDHTFAWAQWKRGEIDERAYRQHPRRSILYDVMGAGHDTIRPYLGSANMQSGDRVLLCTDGLINGLWEKTIIEILNKNNSAEDAVKELCLRANRADGKDDTSLILIDY